MKIRAFLFAAAFLFLFAFTAGTAIAGPAVSVSVAPPMITNQGDEAIFTLTVSPPATREIKVRFFLSGTVRRNGFELFGDIRGGYIVIPAGESKSLITLRSLDADDFHPTVTVLFDVMGGKNYRVGSPSHAKLTIQNLR